MLRELSNAEIGAISGGLDMEPSFEEGGFTGDGGFQGEDGNHYGGGGAGSSYGLGDMGGWSLSPGQDTPSTYGPSDSSGAPYDSSTDPNSYNYGNDPSNSYMSGSQDSGYSAPVNSGTSALNDQPSYAPPVQGIPSSTNTPWVNQGGGTARPPRRPGSMSNTPWVNQGGGTAGQFGVYGPLTNPTGIRGGVRQQY